MKIEESMNADDKKRYKLVRSDSLKDVPGEIIAADEATGEIKVLIAGEVQSFTFGPGAIRIVTKGR